MSDASGVGGKIIYVDCSETTNGVHIRSLGRVHIQQAGVSHRVSWLTQREIEGRTHRGGRRGAEKLGGIFHPGGGERKQVFMSLSVHGYLRIIS